MLLSRLRRILSRSAVLGIFTALFYAPAVWSDTPTTATLDDLIESYRAAGKQKPEDFANVAPLGPIPWLTLRPNDAQDDWSYWSYWSTVAANSAAVRAEGMPSANVRIQTKNKNNAETLVVRAFGTNPSDENAVDIEGSATLPTPGVLVPNAEDEGSITLATPTNLIPGSSIIASATIGDGPFGSDGTGTGDFDFYMIRNVRAGQTISVAVNTPDLFGPLDPFVVVYDRNGNIIAFDDDGGPGFDSKLALSAPVDGDYYVSVGGFGSFALADPFDSSSGTGASSEGIYDVTIDLEALDPLYLRFKLRNGDILGASINGVPGRLSLMDKTGLERQGSSQDLGFIRPDASPLPSGTAALSHTAAKTGDFTLKVTPGDGGDYTVSLRVFKNPLLSGAKGHRQIVFLDFDGETLDVGATFLNLPPGTLVSTLSPLVDYLPGWGLTPADEDDVIDAIIASVHESLVKDVDKLGREANFDIQLLNSRDHVDPFGDPNVSRVIVGGSIDEFGISTIGIAESIDVGNFETEETGVVLLDLLSAPAINPNSLNSIPLAPGASIFTLIGAGVGNIAAHEAGHFLANWHTDQFNDKPNIMDQGGNLPNTVGTGPDGIFGTLDDEDVDFGLDMFVPNEGFTGTRDTLNAVAIGDPAPPWKREK